MSVYRYISSHIFDNYQSVVECIIYDSPTKACDGLQVLFWYSQMIHIGERRGNIQTNGLQTETTMTLVKHSDIPQCQIYYKF